MKPKPRNTVGYEWDIEAMDGEEIVDHNFSDNLDFPDAELTDALKAGTLVLVRTVGNDNDGVLDRTWAYVKGFILPEHCKMPTYFKNAFDHDCTKVPAKYHNELKRRMQDLGLVKGITLAKQQLAAQ